MILYGEDVDLDQLNPTVYRDLVNQLNDNSAWMKVATYLVETRDSFSRKEWIEDLERQGNARNATDTHAELLLNKLKIKLCDVAVLCEMLEQCELLDALYTIVGEDDLEIIEQPYPNANGRPYEAAIGDTISITCKAKGLPPPKYLWYHGNVELPDQTSSTLRLEIISPNQEGEYQCRVSHYDRDGKLIHQIYSKCASLEIKPFAPKITKRLPMQAEIRIGESLVLNCEAEGHPKPEYQWHKNGKKLRGKTYSTLRIDEFQEDNKGSYHCVASNEINDASTNKTEVKVDYPRQKASAKIALLIANSRYQHVNRLRLAENDARVIAELLQSQGFHVICLQNLTLKEMEHAVEIFCGTLKPNTYGVFYFVGHGFKYLDFHMMPIDVHEPFLIKNAFSQDKLMSYLKEKKPALFVAILDMCLVVPNKERNPEIHEEESGKPCDVKCEVENIFIAYSTSSNCPSYESNSAENGIYASHLRKHLAIDKSVREVLEDTAYAVTESRSKKTGEQRPMFTIVPAKPVRYLTDTVICKDSGLRQDFYLYLNGLKTFRTDPIKLKFSKGVTCRVTIRPLKPPYLNVILLTTSGLEEWDVSFSKSPDDRAELSPQGRNCRIYHPQRSSPPKNCISDTKGRSVIGTIKVDLSKENMIHWCLL